MLIFAWSACRLFLSIGKMGIIKIIVLEWPSSVLGLIIALSCITNNIGDALSKVLLSFLFGQLAWKNVFYISAGTSLALAIPVLFVRDRKPPVEKHVISSTNLEKVEENVKESIIEPIGKVLFFRSIGRLMNTRMLLLMISCNAISCLCEIIGSWSINFLKDSLNVDKASAGIWTGVFCVFRYHHPTPLTSQCIRNINRRQINRLSPTPPSHPPSACFFSH
jgi:sugar phosphate permease